MDFYLDRASIIIRDGEVEFWDVVIFHQPTQKDEPSGRLIKEKRTLRRADCMTQEQALLKGSSFDENGRLIEALTLSPGAIRRSSVRPGTIAASELYRACTEAGIEVPFAPPARALPAPPAEPHARP